MVPRLETLFLRHKRAGVLALTHKPSTKEVEAEDVGQGIRSSKATFQTTATVTIPQEGTCCVLHRRRQFKLASSSSDLPNYCL